MDHVAPITGAASAGGKISQLPEGNVAARLRARLKQRIGRAGG
jgi:hypothetical protein